MVNYQETGLKLANIQLKKFKSADKKKKRAMLKLTKKNFEDKKFPH